ncbi:MAG: carboxypeptidase regulatory-like domain-containing protein, partial [Roseiflexaceae bacterium]|nr:carboxypeptidase regulatory-like domain-containing protein [Roseiflexaceae bacterium]
MPQALAAGTITGTVYRDYNASGARDAIEPQIAAITVTAYDASNVARGAATTVRCTAAGAGVDANGSAVAAAAAAGCTGSDTGANYSLTATGVGPYRIEFSGWPAFLQPGAVGTANGSAVQFTPDGSKPGVSMGLNNPAQYCENNPSLATSCYVFGDQINGSNKNGVAVLNFPYASGTTAAAGSINSNPQPGGASINGAYALDAKASDIGAVWGMAYQRSSNNLFLASFMKRHVGYGPTGNPGTIYRIDRTAALPNASAYATLSAGPNQHTPTNTAANAGQPVYFDDLGAFNSVGYTAIGDLELSDDEATLYAVNMFDGKVYAYAIGSPTVAVPPAPTSITPPTPTTGVNATQGCAVANTRPGALKFYDGALYVGLTCTGPLTTDLRSYVYRFNTSTATFTTNAVAEVALNYTRGFASSSGACPANCASANWQPWVTDTNSNPIDDISYFSGYTQYYKPQPWLLDIEIDEYGFMLLNFADRLGHQLGNRNGGAAAGPVEGVSAGDMLRLSPAAGVWAIENNASVGVGLPGGGTTGGAGTSQGPGGGEYYYEDRYSAGTGHAEVYLAGAAQVYGKGEVVNAAFDPAMNGAYRAGGIVMSRHSTGRRTRSIQLFGQDATGTFGKAAGIGDTEAMCQSAPIEIGNRIWRDDNANGVQDPGEPALDGVTVQLKDGAGVAVAGAIALTDANGNYVFSSDPLRANTTSAKYNLLIQPNTNYRVSIDTTQAVLNGWPVTLANADISTNGDSRDSDAAQFGSAAEINLTTGAPGANNHTYDVGFAPYSVGNRVWFDINNNGLLDIGESGIPTVGISLFADTNANGTPDSPTPLATSITDANGRYRFDNLAAGTYLVRVDPVNFQTGGPLNGRFSSTTTVATPNGDIDSDDNGIDNANQAANGVLSGPITLGPGTSEPTGETDLSASGQGSADNQANMTVDFGFFEKLSLGNFVWYDTNNNGQFDAGEQPIPGVTLRLFADTNGNSTLDAGDAAVGSSQTTDASGQYLFTGLDAGSYFVQILPANFLSGGALAGYSNSSGASPGDANNNKDHGTLVGGQGVVSELVALTFGGEPIGDGDANANTNLTIDFGFYHLSVGNELWHDDDNDGVIDAGEQPFSGVRVELYDSVNTLIAVTTTAANGQYLFTQQTDSAGASAGAGLVAGDYYIAIPAAQFGGGSLLDGYYSSSGNDAGDLTNNNDNGIDAAAPATTGIRSATFTLTPGSEPTVSNATGATSNTTIDFGFYTLSLGNLVWNDVNNNGSFDVGEAPLQSVAVNLYYDADGSGALNGGEFTAAQSTATNASGHYLFSGLAEGNYLVELATSNFAIGGPYRGFISSTGTTGSISGPYEPAPDPDLNSADSRDNGTTIDLFAPLPYIQSGLVTLTAGNEPSSAVETGGNTLPNPAPDTNSNLTVDFGLSAPVGLGNIIWIDANNNGTRDVAEIDAPTGVKVNLYYDANDDGTIGGAETTLLLTTDFNSLFAGEYIFAALAPGNYLVEIDPANFAVGGLLEGYTSSTGANGSATGPSEAAPNPNSDIDDDDNGSVVGTLGSGGSIRSVLVTLTLNGEPTGEAGPAQPPSLDANVNTTIDFGVFQPASVGNRVWYDIDLDGLQDVGEPGGIQGVTVSLYDSADDSFVATTTTDANGAYQFNNLVPGTYHIVFSTLPTGYVFTLQDQVGDDATDSDADPIGGETADFTLAAGTNNPDLDAGAYNDTRASLGNFVWYDVNEDGVQDAGELGVPGVMVQLYNAGNTLLATTATDAAGAYLFSNLLLGDYYVVFTPPANYAFSPQDTGGNTAASDLTDSDADPTTRRTITTSLAPGETDISWDAGIYYTKVALGNRIWKDTNDDGQDNGYGGGIANVTVNLYLDSDDSGAPDGGIIATTATDANGFYLFTNLDPDTYIVEVESV